MSPEKTPLLVVDDDETFRAVLSRELARRGYAVAMAGSGGEALARVAEAEPRVVLLDLKLPDADGLSVLKSLRERSKELEIIMLTGHGTIDNAIEAIRLGAFDYASKPCPVDELEIRIQRACERQTLRARNSVLERGLMPADPGPVVGKSPAFLELLRRAERVAATDSVALILGETGAGKEVLAKHIHASSPRARRPFVVVECAALQENLLLSELFGHEKGAFTGADRPKPGLFEVAEGGTLFLDEIGEVSPATQVKLLRVLDTGTFRRVGGTGEHTADVRVLAATNRDIPALVKQGLFREDFYYRTSTVTLLVPPLRERREDIDALVEHTVGLWSARFGVARRVSAEAMDLLRRYNWPGNVRELYHAIESATIVCDGPEIRPEHLPPALRGVAPAAGFAPCPSEPLVTLAEVERAHIERVLAAVGGRRREAASILGISERNLYRKIEDFRRHSTHAAPP